MKHVKINIVFLLGVIGLLISGCTLAVNTQKPVIIRDTVYVEKYWGGDVPINPNWKVYPSFDSLEFKKRVQVNKHTGFTLDSQWDRMAEQAKGETDKLFKCKIKVYKVPPFKDYKVHIYYEESDDIIYNYKYINELDYAIWRYR